MIHACLVLALLSQAPSPHDHRSRENRRAGARKSAAGVVLSVSTESGRVTGGEGVVSSSPSGVSCGASCSATYSLGTTVTLTPTPTGSAFFSSWSGSCSGDAGCSVTMSAAKSVGATFLCDGGPDSLITSPLDMTAVSWNAYGNVAAAPIVTSGAGDPAGGLHGNRVRFAAVPSASQESTLYQNIGGDCIGATCQYSIWLRARPGGTGPSSGMLPIARAQDAGDGTFPLYCAFTAAWSRCVLSHVNTGTHALWWMGYASYANGSGTGPAMDLELAFPKVELRSTPTAFSCSPYLQTQVTADWGIQVRDGAGMVAMADGTLVLLGGWNGSLIAEWGNNFTTNQIYHSTDNGATWQVTLAHDDAPPQTGAGQRWRRRHSHGTLLATIGGTEYIYVIGGDHLDAVFYGAGVYPSDVWRSADKGATWTRMAVGAPWGNRMLHSVWYFGDALYVAGGQSDITDKSTVLHDVWKSVDGGATWVSMGNAPWVGRGTQIQPPTFAGKVWLIGGEGYDSFLSNDYHNDVWSFDGASWTQVLADSAAPWSARAYLNTVTWDSRLWVIRGNNGSNLADAWWSLDGANWLRNDWDFGGADHAGTATVTTDGSNKLIITGGVGVGPNVWSFSAPTLRPL